MGKSLEEDDDSVNRIGGDTMNLKVKERMDLVQYAVDAMGRVAEEIRGQSTVGSVQVLLRLSEGEVTPKELADALDAEEDEVAESMEVFEEFGIIEVVDSAVPSYVYVGYPDEIKFLLANKAAVKKKFESAIKDIETVLDQQTPQTDREKNDFAVVSTMVQQMRKDYDL